MATVLTTQIITRATQAVDTYSGTASRLYSDLQTEINGLTVQNFNGDASNGYNEFFQSKVTPALTENLTALTNSIKKILESIQEQLMRQVDPQLGETNRNPGGGV